MTVSEVTHDLAHSKALRQSLDEVSTVNRSGRVFLGFVLVISAVGLWLVPVTEGDAAMRLIKLLISLVLLGLGGMFISSISERESVPDVVIDTKARELRVVHRGSRMGRAVETRYALDDLADVSINNNLFSAIAKSGGTIVAIPVPDNRVQATLRKALSNMA